MHSHEPHLHQAPPTPILALEGPRSAGIFRLPSPAGDSQGEHSDPTAWIQRIFDNISDAVAQLDVQGRYLFVSASHQRVVGRGAEILGTCCFDYVHPDDREVAAATFARAMQTGEETKLEHRYLHPQKGYIWLESMGRRLVGPDGAPVAVITSRDSTDRRRAEEELRQSAAAVTAANKALEEATRAAQAANQAKSDFLTSMSHEIRTPMTAILGYADLLLSETDQDCTPAHRVHSLEAIKRNGEHLLALINGILDLSKIEAGKLAIERIRCSPLHVVAEVASLMRVRADAKRLRLVTEIVGPVPETIQTDPLRLRQILVNLVGNAIKFTDEGEVRIATRLVMLGNSPRLQFEVRDTGIGMTQEQVARLFVPFGQVDPDAARKYGGTGLGLAISKRLAEALGGTISVVSTPGKGSTFSVTIATGPLDGVRMVQSAQEVVGPLAQQPGPPAQPVTLNCRLLLAEDGPDNQRLIALLLRKAGATVTVVDNGQLAVEQAWAAWQSGEPFDAILMDMQMPVLDGYAATRQLRQRGYRGPIIALTAHAMAEDSRKCLDAGCDDYLSKPVNRLDLIGAVARHVSRAEAIKPQATAGDSTSVAPNAPG